MTEVKGNITVKGGASTDSFVTDAHFTADKNLSFRLGDGDNTITLGDGSVLVTVLGRVQVQTGAGNDLITLDGVAVAGTVDIKTGGGADLLSIEDGSRFVKTFKADMGAGDDTISIAQNTATTVPPQGPVAFTGKATIKAGIGNDTLYLGLDLISMGGDGTSLATFATPTSSIDGGTGLDTYEPGDGQVTGLTLVPNWD